MRETILWIIGAMVGLFLFLGFVYTMGWFGVGYNRTVGVAQEEVRRYKYEHSTAYIQGKKQEAVKYYRDYQKQDSIGKVAICNMVTQTFAEFDLNELQEPTKGFVESCMYGK